ncbi:hypothetical protein M23134_06806 [Microscilla marina ATCC 23134]|uniref:Uncharacterized protein n=1 Tax=Microscilla marina ATCC 23134 TaxID=313606 RepID=A1ZWS8_MICM2|nr:hypothetical protein M23134_06806 [Microscilla marina ATCC 23134]
MIVIFNPAAMLITKSLPEVEPVLNEMSGLRERFFCLFRIFLYKQSIITYFYKNL